MYDDRKKIPFSQLLTLGRKEKSMGRKFVEAAGMDFLFFTETKQKV